VKNPVFYTANPERADRFALETKIFVSGKDLVSEKRALSPESVPHLKQLVENYQTISDMKDLNRLIRVVPAISEGNDSVTFEYIKGDSVERLLLKALLQERSTEIVKIVDTMIKLIDCLPQVNINPEANTDYVKVFDNAYKDTRDCVEPGLIDLNLDNIIIDSKGRWNLFDYEWLFSFPVPRLYLIQRFLWWFVIRHQDTFQYYASRLACVAIGDNVLIPEKLFISYGKYFNSFDECLKAESAFQAYVNGTAKKASGFISYKEVLKHPEYKPMGIDRILLHEGRANRMAEKIRQLEARISELETQRAKSYKHSIHKVVNRLSKSK